MTAIPVMSIGVITGIKPAMYLLGGLLIVFGFIIWLNGAVLSKLDDKINKSQLVTTGVYAWVRNPIYVGITMVLSGILFFKNNLLILAIPILFWAILTVMVKKEEAVLTEVFGNEYLQYKKKVNRCIPWFPSKK